MANVIYVWFFWEGFCAYSLEIAEITVNLIAFTIYKLKK